MLDEVNLAHFLTLTRPLAVLDLETTGFNPEADRIVEFALTMHYPDKDPVRWFTLLNPGCKIPNSNIHQITDAMVMGKPTFEELGPALAPRFLGCDILGYNVDFDVKFVAAQMKRVGASWPWDGDTIDAFEIFKKVTPRQLSDAYKEYGAPDGGRLPTEATLEGAHGAHVDVQATEIVLRGQLLRHATLPRTVKALAEFCFPAKVDWIDSKGKFRFVDGVPCITFGKYVKNNGGQPVPMDKVEKNYYKFICDKDFEPELKTIAAAALMGNWPVAKAKVEDDAPF